MTSLRSACGTTGSLTWIVAFVVLAGDALSQPAAGAARTRSVTDAAELQEWRAIVNRQLTAIAREESRSGPFSEALVDPLMSLGLAQQEYGEHELAVESLGRALQITRVNEGLHTLDQAPMLRTMMASELAQGNVESAVELESQLLQLARRNPGDLRVVPIFRDAADRRLAEYERYLAGDAPPEISISLGYMGSRSAGSPRVARASSLWRARRYYRAAMRTLSGSGTSARDELVDLDRTLIRTYYLEATSDVGVADESGFLYALGSQSYGRLLSYSAMGSATALDVATVLVEMADWDLLFSRNGRAVDRYDQAYAILVAGGVPNDSIRELFPTNPPVLLPAFVRNPLVAKEPGEPRGYVDIAFDLTKYGDSRKEKVIAVTGDGVDRFENDARAFVGRSRFRPNPAGHEHAAPYRLRYYVAGPK